MVRRGSLSSKDEVNGNDSEDEYIGTGSDHSMVFHTSDVLGLAIANVPEVVTTVQNGMHKRLLIWLTFTHYSRRHCSRLSY